LPELAVGSTMVLEQCYLVLTINLLSCAEAIPQKKNFAANTTSSPNNF